MHVGRFEIESIRFTENGFGVRWTSQRLVHLNVAVAPRWLRPWNVRIPRRRRAQQSGFSVQSKRRVGAPRTSRESQKLPVICERQPKMGQGEPLEFVEYEVLMRLWSILSVRPEKSERSIAGSSSQSILCLATKEIRSFERVEHQCSRTQRASQRPCLRS